MTACFNRTFRRIAAVSLGLLAITGAGLTAAQAWPSKPVTLVVGTPAGGAIDAYARTLADHLTRQTGGTFLVDNRVGAAGNISAEHVLKAAPDGHTVWGGIFLSIL